jgi:hypothetical protein
LRKLWFRSSIPQGCEEEEEEEEEEEDRIKEGRE